MRAAPPDSKKVSQMYFGKHHLRVPKLSTIVDTRIFYHIYWKNFRIPIFSSGFLKFCSGLYI
jgi:hypothetical protein